MRRGSWLFPNGDNRERMLELDRQLRPVRRAAFGVLVVSVIICGPWLGWWTILPLVLAAIVFRLGDVHMEKTRQPEYTMLAAWVGAEVIMALSVAVSGGPTVPTTAWLAIPVVTLGARFSERGIAAGVGLAIALLVAVELGVDAHAVISDPPLLVAPIALTVCVALFQTVLMRSEIRLRGEVSIDELTGMLNRRALLRRADELAQQSRITRQPISLIVGDIDSFKQVNDSYGHAAGDVVLAEIATVLRTTLRAFDLCYRLGGEEFVLLLPGAAIEQSLELAEELRAAVEAAESGGCRVTMSFGVAATRPGEPFTYNAMFGAADAAMYEAKRTGRNRVCRALPPPAEPLAA
jgi:diguanylate cyclase (GGDEF)-like protein